MHAKRGNKKKTNVIRVAANVTKSHQQIPPSIEPLKIKKPRVIPALNASEPRVGLPNIIEDD